MQKKQDVDNLVALFDSGHGGLPKMKETILCVLFILNHVLGYLITFRDGISDLYCSQPQGGDGDVSASLLGSSHVIYLCMESMVHPLSGQCV